MGIRDRAFLTFGIWFLILGALVGSVAILSGAEEWLILVFSVLMLSAGISVTGFVWNWGNLKFADIANQAQQEKNKRDKLDVMLKDLSDTQLERLRDRLASGEITDEHIDRLLSEDGEKLKRRF